MSLTAVIYRQMQDISLRTTATLRTKKKNLCDDQTTGTCYCTLFCSFSSAETQWIHLLRILGKLVDHKDYSDDELENLNWEEKCRLIQSDPVTCARHFDYQFNQFLRHFLMSSAAPLGKIADWFYRVEYQQRGSPHIHMLFWLESAPVYGCDNDEDVTSFIKKNILF